MKKYYSYTLIATALMLTTTSIAFAQENGQHPPMPLRPGAIGQQLRENYQDRIQNIRNNEGNRNGILENRTGSSSHPMMEKRMDMRNGTGTPRMMERKDELRERCEEFLKNHASSTDMASSTMDKPCREAREMIKDHRDEASSTMHENREGRKEDRREFRMEEFKHRKENVLKQMTNALNNLTQIRTRIDSRIQKEQTAGTDMSAAITLLATADQKITLATTAVNALSAYIPTASSTASTTVDVQNARKLAETAIKAVGDARKALNEVVRSIAHTLGLDLGEEKRTQEATTTSAQ